MGAGHWPPPGEKQMQRRRRHRVRWRGKGERGEGKGGPGTSGKRCRSSLGVPPSGQRLNLKQTATKPVPESGLGNWLCPKATTQRVLQIQPLLGHLRPRSQLRSPGEEPHHPPNQPKSCAPKVLQKHRFYISLIISAINFPPKQLKPCKHRRASLP